MTIQKNLENRTLTLSIAGRLDTSTAPELESLLPSLADANTLVLDLTALEYISSAGLRIILKFQKTMTAQGGAMHVCHPNESVSEVFEITGFSDFLTIEA